MYNFAIRVPINLPYLHIIAAADTSCVCTQNEKAVLKEFLVNLFAKVRTPPTQTERTQFDSEREIQLLHEKFVCINEIFEKAANENTSIVKAEKAQKDAFLCNLAQNTNLSESLLVKECEKFIDAIKVPSLEKIRELIIARTKDFVLEKTVSEHPIVQLFGSHSPQIVNFIIKHIHEKLGIKKTDSLYIEAIRDNYAERWGQQITKLIDKKDFFDDILCDFYGIYEGYLIKSAVEWLNKTKPQLKDVEAKAPELKDEMDIESDGNTIECVIQNCFSSSSEPGFDEEAVHLLLDDELTSIAKLKPPIMADFEEVIRKVCADGMVLKDLDSIWQKNQAVVLTAYQQNPHSFQYANSTCVYKLIKKHPEMLQHASEAARKNRLFILWDNRGGGVLEFNARAFQYAHDDLRKDKEFVLALLYENQHRAFSLEQIGIFKDVHPELKQDKEFIIETLRATYVTPDRFKRELNQLKDDKEFVLELIEIFKSRSHRLENLLEQCDWSKEIELEFVKSNICLFKSCKNKEDKEFFLSATETMSRSDFHQYTSERYRVTMFNKFGYGQVMQDPKLYDLFEDHITLTHMIKSTWQSSFSWFRS